MTASPLVADLRERGFPLEELDRVAREGTEQEVSDLCHAIAFTHKGLRMRFRKDFDAKRRALEAERAKKSPC